MRPTPPPVQGAGPNAPDRKTAGRVIANFAQLVKEGELRLHPQIGGLVEKDLLEKMGGSRGPVAGGA